jgi:MoaA/NifB/PqqE/SkfB family radical SAM enzyme
LIVDATEVCNLACIHCAHPQFKKSEYYSAKHLKAELCQKAVDEVATAGHGKCQYIRFTGEGEPLLHPRIFDMIEYAVKNARTTVTITTNGSLGRGDKLDALLATGIDLIDISIDANTPETYAEIRVNGDLTVTRANVLQLIQGSKQPGSKTKVVVSYIEQPQNMHETADFEKYWKDQGADYVVIRRLHSNAGALVQLADQMRNDNLAEPRRPCLYPWERIVLNPRGFLSFCPADWTHGSTVVDYATTTIAETWRGAFYEGLRQAHLTGNYANHSFCGQCPDWRSTRWPNEGRSYANMVEEFKGRE